jgi:hypothetical protein
MINGNPPSGAWTGYYLYGDEGPKHLMALSITFARDGKIRGEGLDDIGAFAIEGSVDRSVSVARWGKAYVGRHTVQYSGIYSRGGICGHWTLNGLVGGFWIWPGEAGQSEESATHEELGPPLEAVFSARQSNPVSK